MDWGSAVKSKYVGVPNQSRAVYICNGYTPFTICLNVAQGNIVVSEHRRCEDKRNITEDIQKTVYNRCIAHIYSTLIFFKMLTKHKREVQKLHPNFTFSKVFTSGLIAIAQFYIVKHPHMTLPLNVKHFSSH